MEKVLKQYPKAIVHLRQQYNSGRLGLVFGAGICRDLGFPNWTDLVKGVANHVFINGKNIHDNVSKWSNSSAITQLLYQHFKKRRLSELEKEFPSIAYRERRVMSDWREVVHDVLYKSALTSRRFKVEKHPYLKEFIPLIRHSEFTINYNFDDTLEFMLSEWSESDSRGKAYQAVWNPHMQFLKNTAVIYHPNGYLPGDKNLHQSEELVFSEESFSDQLIQSMSGKLSTLLHQFTKKTCLFVGLSLGDNTLKHLLRQSAAICPGNYHYFVRYTSDNNELTPDEKHAIFNSNFEVYNLITLFINSHEISSLAKFITMGSEEFKNEAAISGVDVKYTYYLVGAVAAGKSTVLTHFGNLKVFEEWIGERPHDMSRPFDELTDAEKLSVDNWVDSQFFEKNRKLLTENEGIHIVDRTPLDPITFTKSDSEMRARAVSMLAAISPGKSKYHIDMGQVILLRSTPSELKTRLLAKRKTNWSENLIELLQNRALGIYEGFHLREVENMSRSISDVVKEIAKIIFVEDYKPTNLHDKLKEVASL